MIACKALKLLRIIMIAMTILTFPGGFSSARAQGGGFSISPLSYEQQLEPGDRHQGTVSVRNVGDFPLTFQVYSMDATIAGGAEGGIRFLEPGRMPDSSADWYAISPAHFTLGPQELMDITFTVTVPENAFPGSYTGVIFAETIPHEAGGNPVGNRIGMLTYLTVGDPEPAQVVVASLSASRLWGQRIPLRLGIINASSALVPFQGQIQIWRQGRQLDELKISRGILHPHEDRTVDVEWQRSPAWGRHDIRALVEVSTGEILEAWQTMYIIPWQSLVGVLLSIGGIGMMKLRRKKPVHGGLNRIQS